MNITAGILSKPSTGQVANLVVQVVEELWQKGYDLQKAGMGWVVKEPLASKKIELASDAELFDYAAKRVKTNIPSAVVRNPEVPLSSLAATYTENVLPANIVPRHETGSASVALVMPTPVRNSRFRFGLLTMLALVIAGLVLGFGMNSHAVHESQHLLETGGKSEKASGPVSTGEKNQQPTSKNDVSNGLPPPQQQQRQPVDIEQAVHVSETIPTERDSSVTENDLTIPAEACVSRLREVFQASNLRPLANRRNPQSETCYVIQGKEHCPYLSGGRVTINFANGMQSPITVFACDIDVKQRSVTSLRVVDINPDIVRFLMTEEAGGT